MDELALNSEIRYLHEILKIDVAVNGGKDTMFTWGGLTVRRSIGNRIGDDALNREKSAEAIVPECTPRTGYGEGPNAILQQSES